MLHIQGGTLGNHGKELCGDKESFIRCIIKKTKNAENYVKNATVCMNVS